MTRLVVAWAFDVLGVHRLQLEVPVDNHPGYDVDQWVVKVRVRLKEMNPPELDRYFMSCPLTLTPIERLECYMERIETIIGKIKNRVRH